MSQNNNDQELQNRQESPQEPSETSAQASGPEQVICPGNKESVVRYFIIAAIFLGGSIWCILDWAKYPRPEEPFSTETLNGYFEWAFNHFLPFVAIPIALLFAAKAIKTLKMQVIADDEGIRKGATRLAWSDIDRLDASRLPKKQILDLYYGPDKRLRLHGIHLVNWKTLVALIDRKIPEDKKTTAEAS